MGSNMAIYPGATPVYGQPVSTVGTTSGQPAFPITNLMMIDLQPGTGEAVRPGQKITVDYTGKLVSTGEVFDSSIGRAPFQFTLGAGDVIAGWDQGIAGMREGGKRLLVIPASLAYGAAGSPPTIPPNAPLMFEVELKAIERAASV